LVRGAATEGFDRSMGFPALDDVDAAGVELIGSDGEVEAAGCPTALSATLLQPAT